MTGFTQDDVEEATVENTDNFGRAFRNRVTDLINVPGEHDFTPERLRYLKDGSRRFLEYGTDANYSETATGHLLEPDSDQYLELRLAERTAYPVGFDLWPSVSRRLTQAPQAGDFAWGGYGNPDPSNFDPEAIEYSGTTADGFFWYHTADTGLEEVVLAGVRGGTVFYDRQVPLGKAADVLSILEKRFNWYAVGPCVTRQSYTNIAANPDDPQVNQVIGAVAADDGKGPERGSHRVTMGVYQAAGNSGLGLEAGSMSIKTCGKPDYQFKQKGHSVDLEVTNSTDGVYQVCGAMRTDPDRPTVKMSIPEFQIIKTPGSSVNRVRVLFIAVSPEETNAPTGEKGGTITTWQTPPEHNPKNSVLEEIEDNTLTGPVQDDAGTDASGPTTANTMTEPGGYQLGRQSVTPEGQGSGSVVSRSGQIGERALYDTDVCLILVDATVTGTVEIDIETAQNS